MFIKKKSKKGSTLLQASIVLMIVTFIVTLSLKVISNNLLKSKLYYTYENINSLNYKESEFLQLSNKFINLDISTYESLKNEAIKQLKEVKIYSNDNYKNYSIIHDGRNLFMIEIKGKGKRYIGLYEIIEEDKVYLIPNTYKTDFIL
ncbi:hypothetical protein [Clostridium isatidis]|uniref:Uncharacterized protein n=1 Tax=Clostridium isatidis TaxID=182773 RepID=A0A343JAW5_9CLOT|nr:hypothetical protein [Clostridium isatidis]ASW42673.1 hypothetical protein BEN51_04020 [Clostridium isatidis]NLZ33630.1 hypothetical protein [Clostridiales bacterium]